MPVVSDLQREARKSLIIHELTKPDGAKDYKGIATKYKWDSGLTKELLSDLDSELAHINAFNRLALTIRAGPKAIDRLDSALTTDYVDPDLALRAGELGLRTLKALDPKLRTVPIDVAHSGNILMTIHNAQKAQDNKIDAMFEVIDQSIPDKASLDAISSNMGDDSGQGHTPLPPAPIVEPILPELEKEPIPQPLPSPTNYLQVLARRGK